MTIAETLLPEFEEEMVITRRLLERVPTDKGQWKPHQKSFSLGHLAQLVAWMPGWIAQTIRETELNLAGQAGYSYEKTDDLLKMFDKNVQDARDALTSSKDADYKVNWSLKFGERVVMTQPRAKIVRQHINHLIHHRGQLTVYLRLVDVPIPSIYGPTADENMPGF
ncbi:MAG: DinB family protein [Gemmatimonadaceae bacterium]